MIHTEIMKKALSEVEKSEFGPMILNREDISLLYSLGYSLYQANDLEQSEVIFRRLVVADPLERKHWWAFGAVLQGKKNYEKALTAWSMCCLLDDEDPTAHFHAAECFLSLSHKEEALKALAAARERCKDEHESLEQKITLLEGIWPIEKEKA